VVSLTSVFWATVTNEHFLATIGRGENKTSSSLFGHKEVTMLMIPNNAFSTLSQKNRAAKFRRNAYEDGISFTKQRQ
jgi:hypothetical protein